jgi:plasmid stabilization system protein ParE
MRVSAGAPRDARDGRGNICCGGASNCSDGSTCLKEQIMPRGDKSSYTPKQKRKARHIEESYEERGLDEREAAARAWATVNKQTGGGERSGSGRKNSASSKSSARKDSARRAVATKHGHSPNRGRMSSRARHSST